MIFEAVNSSGVGSVIEPGLELGEERNRLLLPFAQPLLIAPIFDPAFNAKWLPVERQRFVRSPGLHEQIHSLHELAAGVRISGKVVSPV